ncbi:Nucleoside transporter [Candidatus Desulfarcum epimagneticum]|uniref:Nucleoside transporter n=1 Tax=uncultured Desulfobacteraceae bacterium TaxID=218296 RepID=A0A484HCE3_9BACT|nr:Nucleoside transporter [uncultured Desulfobacteraceae bacterium]
MTYHLISLAGAFALMGVAWLFSTHPRRLNFKTIAWGVGLQAALAAVVFLAPASRGLFLTLNDITNSLLASAMAGARFCFGYLSGGPAPFEASKPQFGFILAFQGLPTILFFSALISILYFYGIMQAVIRLFGRLFSRLMKISGAEAVAVSSNIFVGVESMLAIRPHIRRMTRSELCLVLTAGMATVASNVLLIYVLFLRDVFPAIAGHLISASILSAPAAVVMSKILMPETETPETLGKAARIHAEKEDNVFAAVISGANSGVRLVVGIVALLVAVLGLAALADSLLGWGWGHAGGWLGMGGELSLKTIMGWVAYPFVLIMGVPPEDALAVSKIVGSRTIITELAAYGDLAGAIRENAIVHPRSAVIAAYALCGFSHIASMSIFVGGAAALAPERTRDISAAGLRALAAATLACLMTGCMAGLFYTNDGSILLGG